MTRTTTSSSIMVNPRSSIPAVIGRCKPILSVTSGRSNERPTTTKGGPEGPPLSDRLLRGCAYQVPVPPPVPGQPPLPAAVQVRV